MKLRRCSRHHLFQPFEGIFRHFYLRIEMFGIAEHQFLLERVDQENEVAVDDMALAYAQEQTCIVAHLVDKRLLHLPQVHAHRAAQFIGKNDGGVVTVGLKIHDVAHIEAEHLVTRVEEDIIR